MQFGLVFANVGPVGTDGEGLTKFVQHAEEMGFDSLWAVEHVVVPAGYQSQYPYSPTGRMPGTEDSDMPDPLAWLTYAAAVTKTIKLATGILILPQRNPLVLAKELATIDRLSGGRFILGIGIGWLKEEFEALGIPWERRTARTEEYVAALRCAWEEKESTFAGEFVKFDRVLSYPKPTNGTIPVVVGGHTEAAARRAGRIGNGFFPANLEEGALPALMKVMREEAEKAGRDPDAIEVSAGGYPSVDDVKRFEDAGAHRVIIPSFLYRQFAEDVISKL